MPSNTERIARALLTRYHPELKQTWNYRPNWLKNPETGRNLEIDIFLKDIQAGIEVQGIQHGRPIDGLQAKYESVPQTFWQRFRVDPPKYRKVEGSAIAGFGKQQRHDALKIERCKEYGVKLYHLTIFNLSEREFLPWLQQFEIDNRLLPNRYASRPTELFAEAEGLSRKKFRAARHPDILPSVWQGAWQRFMEWIRY